eukprot:7471870-Pyramimonas_sp.AAC.1
MDRPTREAPAVSARGGSGPRAFVAWAAGGKDRSSHRCQSRAPVIGDMRTACAARRAHGCMCHFMARAEVVASAGARYLGGLLSGDNQLLWVVTPA